MGVCLDHRLDTRMGISGCGGPPAPTKSTSSTPKPAPFDVVAVGDPNSTTALTLSCGRAPC